MTSRKMTAVDGLKEGRADGAKDGAAVSAVDGKVFCGWCEKTFKPKAKNQKYCSNRHKQYAYKARKEATRKEAVELMVRYGIPRVKAEETAEKVGRYRLAKLLEDYGFRYFEKLRTWR